MAKRTVSVGDATQIGHHNDITEYGDADHDWDEATGTGYHNPISRHNASVAANFTIPASNNGFSAGPLSIVAAVTVTLTAGSAWNVIGQLSFGDGAGITFGDGSILKML